MSKPLLGVVVGAALGVIDGLSAWFSPDARPMILTIVIASTLKGVVTGLLAGTIARWKQSTVFGISAGLLIGLALSSLAALGQPDHYLEIVLPGMLVGALAGFVTQRYPLAKGTIGLLVVALVPALAWPLAALAQPASPDPDPFQRVAFMLGKWEGTQEGQPGKGTAHREISRALNSRFIRVVNRSEYPPQGKNIKGEIHQDEGFFSFDRTRKRLVLRQFHGEGFVNEYVEDEGATLSFTTEAIENIPAGFRARETYVMRGPDEFDEVFEVAQPGKSFEVYSRARFTRVK